MSDDAKKTFDPYKALRLNRSASPEEIKAAYKALAKKLHPDRNIGNPKAAEKFKEVQEAYDLLMDPIRRQRYDETGETDAKNEEHDAVQIIIGVLNSCLVQIYSRGGDPKGQDLVGLMRSNILGGQEKIRSEKKQFIKKNESLRDVAKRFTAAEGMENILQKSIEGTIKLGEDRIKQLVQDEERGAKALALLGKFSYKCSNDAETLFGIIGQAMGHKWIRHEKPVPPKSETEY